MIDKEKEISLRVEKCMNCGEFIFAVYKIKEIKVRNICSEWCYNQFKRWTEL